MHKYTGQCKIGSRQSSLIRACPATNIYYTVGSTKVEIFSLDESSNQIGGEMCDCQPCFTTFSLVEIFVIASIAVGNIAAAYKLSVKKKKVKENKKNGENWKLKLQQDTENPLAMWRQSSWRQNQPNPTNRMLSLLLRETDSLMSHGHEPMEDDSTIDN